MEAACSSETSVDFQLTTRRYIPEHRTLYNHRCDSLKSYSEKGMIVSYVKKIQFSSIQFTYSSAWQQLEAKYYHYQYYYN
jgi:hypothetical protein